MKLGSLLVVCGAAAAHAHVVLEPTGTQELTKRMLPQFVKACKTAAEVAIALFIVEHYVSRVMNSEIPEQLAALVEEAQENKVSLGVAGFAKLLVELEEWGQSMNPEQLNQSMESEQLDQGVDSEQLNPSLKPDDVLRFIRDQWVYTARMFNSNCDTSNFGFFKEVEEQIVSLKQKERNGGLES